MIRIFNGRIIDPSVGLDAQGELLVKDGKILDVGKPGAFAHATAITESIDAQGAWITPGLVDLHVHLREPGQEWKETIKTGSEAAILGGYTTVLAMPNTKPVNDHQEVTQFVLKKAQEAGAARVLPIGSVSKKLEGKEMAPYSELRDAGCVAFSDDGEPVYNAGMMRRALEWCKMLDVPIACHEEDKSLSCGGCMNEGGLATKLGIPGWPKVAEEVMIARDIELARTTKARVHFCHVTTARGVELIRRAKNDGIPVTAEVTPHHLTLTEHAVGEYNTNAKMSPPLREEEDKEALIVGLHDGTIDAVASDHAPHDRDTKEIEFGKASFGILGLQTNLSLLIELVRAERITPSQFIRACSTAPAQSFKLPCGTLQKGAAADITIIDPDHPWTCNVESVHSKSKNSPFYGRTMHGVSRYVLVGGRVVVREGKLSLGSQR
jgi:dihydroorotase